MNFKYLVKTDMKKKNGVCDGDFFGVAVRGSPENRESIFSNQSISALRRYFNIIFEFPVRQKANEGRLRFARERKPPANLYEPRSYRFEFQREKQNPFARQLTLLIH